MMKNCSKSFKDRTIAEEAVCSFKSVSKLILWLVIFFMFALQMGLNLNMMNDIDMLKSQIKNKNEFQLTKSKIQKMSPKFSNQLQRGVKNGR